VRRLFRLTLSVTVDENFGFRVDVTPKIAAADGGIIDGDTGDLLRDDTETETGAVAASLWSDPKVDIDQYGKPTGEDCGVEVLTALADCASHRVPTFRLKGESRCLSLSLSLSLRLFGRECVVLLVFQHIQSNGSVSLSLRIPCERR
jgi:hypothetical protein